MKSFGVIMCGLILTGAFGVLVYSVSRMGHQCSETIDPPEVRCVKAADDLETMRGEGHMTSQDRNAFRLAVYRECLKAARADMDGGVR